MSEAPAQDVQATFCATLVDEWAGAGVRDAVVAPGSRNTPLALALAGHTDIAVHVFHDERAAAFAALGMGLSATPAVLTCTSGTAAVNLHPAVVEASLSDVPLLVVTADRPPELRDVGAPQTIDQTQLYGRAVRWFHDPGVADAASAGAWRSLARRALLAATGAHASAGPVHLNLPFREPLLGTVGELPPRLPLELAADNGRRPSISAARTVGEGVFGVIDRHRGLIVAGGRAGVSPADIGALSAATGWPVLADPCSGVRHLDEAVPAFDALLRHERFAADHRPDVVVRIGRPPASKQLAMWLAAAAPIVVQVGGPGVVDPGHDVAAVLGPGAVAALAASLRGATGTPWLARWRHASAVADETIASALAADDELSEPAVARTVADWLRDDHELVVASSMPVRDLEWYGGHAARAHANRGANGIDGVVSTALGRALATGRTVVALVGDIAMVHDANALVAIGRRAADADLRIVVVDNDGGGIFSFLPQAGELPADRFEQLFGTPHGTDVAALAAAHGVPAITAKTPAALRAALDRPGPSMTIVHTDRRRNVEVHDALHAAVADALSAPLRP